MKLLTALLVSLCVALPAAAADRYPVKGMIVAVNASAGTFTASIDEIPGVMAAMTMPFAVKDAGQLQGLAAGTFVEFTLVVDGQTTLVEGIRIVPFEAVEKDPFAASRLALLDRIVSPRSAPAPLAAGAAVPDFTLRNHRGQRVSLAGQRGKVVAINFIYTRCALPDFCLRLTTHFTSLQQRFAARLGTDLALLTITFDPTHDTQDVLAGYASQWRANPAWHFLTGSEADIARVCRLFGVHAFTNEGLVDHSLHTVIIDRRGRLAANLEGNTFSAAQLGDLIAAQLQ
jgi:protein SCO1/2